MKTKKRNWGYGLVIVSALMIGAVLMATEQKSITATKGDTVVVYKSATCQCCSKWVSHLKQEGFTVEVRTESSLTAIKRQLGVPEGLSSCHTATVGGYVVEGHVPASDVRRLLLERPAGLGIAVPGMPIGSPGMESGDKLEPYDVVLFSASAPNQVFSHHGSVVNPPDQLAPAQ